MIQWPKATYWSRTFNPWIGCKKVSPACDNCYARAIMRRFCPNTSSTEYDDWMEREIDSKAEGAK